MQIKIKEQHYTTQCRKSIFNRVRKKIPKLVNGQTKTTQISSEHIKTRRTQTYYFILFSAELIFYQIMKYMGIKIKKYSKNIRIYRIFFVATFHTYKCYSLRKYQLGRENKLVTFGRGRKYTIYFGNYPAIHPGGNPRIAYIFKNISYIFPLSRK